MKLLYEFPVSKLLHKKGRAAKDHGKMFQSKLAAYFSVIVDCRIPLYVSFHTEFKVQASLEALHNVIKCQSLPLHLARS